jgi:hypothetical protein
MADGRPLDHIRKPTVKPVVKINNFVRKHTQAVGVDALKKSGVTNVNFLTFGKINDLISMAVMAAFEKYQRGFNESEARRIKEEAAGALRERLVLLAGDSGGAAPPEAASGGPESGPGTNGHSGEADPDDESLDPRLFAKDPALRAEILERRLRKVRLRLAETEEALRRFAGESETDPGVPSVYRQVQGLNPADSQFKKKKEMLRIIFEENLELQKSGLTRDAHP